VPDGRKSRPLPQGGLVRYASPVAANTAEPT